MEFESPEIQDEDITWASRALGLPDSAFFGNDGHDARAKLLKSPDALDIEACPGSGKTTLLVAKLAILSRQWKDRTRGICVLSHTNTAREEIEHRLGNTLEGQRLLRYPNYVGTIHGFINEFLALPWLRSLDIPVRTIDDDICIGQRWEMLPDWATNILKGATSRDYLRYRSIDFTPGEIRLGKKVFLEHENTFKAVQRVCRQSAQNGFHCHSEMFVWANNLLDKNPDVSRYIQHRFPLLFVDEAQDNDEDQSALLDRIFGSADTRSTRVRLGDSNQAIFSHSRQEGATTDPFPHDHLRRDIESSFRFGQDIADLANPLAVTPQGLKGVGGESQSTLSSDGSKHAILLFEEHSIGNVLDTYAKILIDEFSPEQLASGKFFAIGGTHRPKQTKHLPYHVGDYWPSYDPNIAGREAKPSTFVQFMNVGRRNADKQNMTQPIVSKFAEAVLIAALRSNPATPSYFGRMPHRHALELLENNKTARNNYLQLVTTLATDPIPLEEKLWESKFLPTVRLIVAEIAKTNALSSGTQTFLEWPQADDPVSLDLPQQQSTNLLEYPTTDPRVRIKVGSIHSVKGQTHTATLVLDTFFNSHHFKMLKKWLFGEKIGGVGESDAYQKRLRLHYVAMTRAERLLCLAIRKDVFSEKEIQKLTTHGWRVGCVTKSKIEWVEPEKSDQ